MTAKMKATTGTMLKIADDEVAEAYFRPMQYKLIVPAILIHRTQTAQCFSGNKRKLICTVMYASAKAHTEITNIPVEAVSKDLHGEPEGQRWRRSLPANAYIHHQMSR